MQRFTRLNQRVAKVLSGTVVGVALGQLIQGLRETLQDSVVAVTVELAQGVAQGSLTVSQRGQSRQFVQSLFQLPRRQDGGTVEFLQLESQKVQFALPSLVITTYLIA